MEINKKILASVFIIGLLAFGLGYGTYSYFSDIETSPGNIFTAGTIDISIDPTGGQKVVTVGGDVELKPSQTGYTTTVITNVGTNPCEVWKHITNVDNREHGVTDAEGKYYAAHPGSEDWKISNWIHYDMLVWKSLGYSWSGHTDVETKEGEPQEIGITVKDGDCEITWTVDFPIDDDPGNGKMVVALTIALDGNGNLPAFQIHNHDWDGGTIEAGTWCYTPNDDTIPGNWNGWMTGTPEKDVYQTLVSDLDWVSCTGDRDHDDNPTGEFTITIDKCKLVGDIHWAIVTTIGTGFFNYATQYKSYPVGFNWGIVDMVIPNYEAASISTLIKEIPEALGWFLTGDSGVASYWIYLGTLEPGGCMCVIQSYHLDALVDNWGQSDRVVFDIEFLAQQIEGELPPQPEPVLDGYGRS